MDDSPSSSLCPPSSGEETLRLFVSLLGSKVAGIREDTDDRSDSHTVLQRPSPRLRALLSTKRPACTGCVNNPVVEASSDEDSVQSAPSPSLAQPSSFPSLAVFKPAEHSSLGMTSRYDYASTQDKDCSSSWALNTALENTSLPISTPTEDIPTATREMASRALDTFAFLTVANTKQFFKIQLERHHQESPKDVADRAQEVATAYFTSMTSAQSGDLPIDVSCASTSFQIADIVNKPAEEEDQVNDKDAPTCLKANLVFNISIDANVHGAKTNAIITAPATIHAYFHGGNNLIDRVDLAVDAPKFLLSMRNQARAMVLKSVSHKDFPVISSTHESNFLSDSVQCTSGSKMTKLAICASLELASVIAEDKTTLASLSPSPPRKTTSKRHLSLTQTAKVPASTKRSRNMTAKKVAGPLTSPPSLTTLSPLRPLAA